MLATTYDAQLNRERLPIRHISAAEGADVWSELIKELALSKTIDRPEIWVERRSCRRTRLIDHIETLVTNGYSIGDETELGVSMSPHPIGVLYLLLDGQTRHTALANAPWCQRDPSDCFRRYHLLFSSLADPSSEGSTAAIAEEVWCLPDFLRAELIPEFVIEFIASRSIDLVHIIGSRIGIDMVSAIKFAYPYVNLVVSLDKENAEHFDYVSYVTSHYGNVIDMYVAGSEDVVVKLGEQHIPPTKIELIDEAGAKDMKAIADRQRAIYAHLIAESVAG